MKGERPGFVVNGQTERDVQRVIMEAQNEGRISFGVIITAPRGDGTFITARDDGMRAQLEQYFRQREFDVH